MHYEGPIYRPPSEADSLLIQATIGCPHNKCTFCMVYKKGPAYRVRPVEEIKADLQEARNTYGPDIRTIFFPAGNTIAMSATDLANICQYARSVFPKCDRITVYGSSKYINQKNESELETLFRSGLTRIHVGLESGDDRVLARTKKGADARTQIQACRKAIEAGLEISVYVVLGLGGRELTLDHARNTARVLGLIKPHFVRLRTFLPKIDTLMLRQVQNGEFQVCSPHEILNEIKIILSDLDIETTIASDHYTNYLDVTGRLPRDKAWLLDMVEKGLARPESSYRQVYVGTQ